MGSKGPARNGWFIEMQLQAACLREADSPSINAAATCAAEFQATPCREILSRFVAETTGSASLLKFAGVDGRDVYNITAPFMFEGKRLIAGRVEQRDSELAELVFFEECGGEWVPVFNSPMLRSLQDPCITFIGDELIVGGVRYPVELPCGGVTWRMEFFRGETLATLRPFLHGPARMKDIRFCEMPDSRIAVFTRPQGIRGGRGKIGFVIADSLDEVTAEMIEIAPVLCGQFASGEWGGANEAHMLADGSVGVLGHIAQWDAHGNRHYFPMAFTLDPETRCTTPIQIIAKRDLFPEAPAKRADLIDVVFSGGLVRGDNGYATFYAGLSDAAAGMIEIEDPFAAVLAASLVARA